jgi:hypothetical protein
MLDGVAARLPLPKVPRHLGGHLMTSRTLFPFFRPLFQSAAILIMSSALCPTVHAQTLLALAPFPDAPRPSAEGAPPAAIKPVIMTPVAIAPTSGNTEHKFWDTQNRVLLFAATALNGADFAVTRANLQSGGQELNPMVRVFGRSTAGLAVNFAGETAGVVSLSYFFHKIGHHKLERAVSLVNIGSSAGAVAYGLAHR